MSVHLRFSQTDSAVLSPHKHPASLNLVFGSRQCKPLWVEARFKPYPTAVLQCGASALLPPSLGAAASGLSLAAAVVQHHLCNPVSKAFMWLHRSSGELQTQQAARFAQHHQPTRGCQQQPTSQ